MAERLVKASFIEPMLLLRTDRLPEGAKQVYEIKLDGFRAPSLSNPVAKYISVPATIRTSAAFVANFERMAREYRGKRVHFSGR